MSVSIQVSSSLPQLYIHYVEAAGLRIEPASADLIAYREQVVERARIRSEQTDYQTQCQEVRQLLRFGKFKATGRSKPAQEYLMRCIVNDGTLPAINGPVDLLNAVSVDCNLPISLLSLAKCSTTLRIDRGQAGQQYVFNSAGQVLDLEDLITVFDCSADPASPRPVGSPVKDSLAGKIEATDNHVVAIIYAPRSPSAIERCQQAMLQLSKGFTQFCGAQVSTSS